MRKGYLFACLLAFALSLIVLAPAEGADIYVDDDDSGGQWSDYTDIQDAIDNAGSGDMIYVYNGTYYENIDILENVTLVGNGTDDTVIDGGDNGDIVRITEDGVTISGFTIQNAFAGQEGIDIAASNVVVDNCTLLDCAYRGIYSISRSNLAVMNVNVTIGGAGITFAYVNSGSIQWTEVNADSTGIGIDTSRYLGLRNITFWDCGFIWVGGSAIYYTTNTVDNCTINGAPVLLYTSHDNETITGDYGQLIVGDCYDFTIEEMDIGGGNNGITIGASERVVVRNVSISEVGYGISLRAGEDITVRDSDITEYSIRGIDFVSMDHVDIIQVDIHTTLNGYGLYIASGNTWINATECDFVTERRGINNRGDGAVFTNNTLDTGWDSIWMSSTDDCVITGNVLESDANGLYFSACDGNLIANNTFKECGQYGLYLQGAENNTVIYNVIYNSTNEGIIVNSASWNNYIHHNNLYDNGGGLSQGRDDSSGTNYWDDDISEGNYWDDWGGTGTYALNGGAGAEDNYPLDDPAKNSAPEKVPELHLMVSLSLLSAFLLIVTRKRRQ